MMRCCRDTIRREDTPKHPIEGLEIPCHWCSDALVWRNGEWRELSTHPAILPLEDELGHLSHALGAVLIDLIGYGFTEEDVVDLVRSIFHPQES